MRCSTDSPVKFSVALWLAVNTSLAVWGMICGSRCPRMFPEGCYRNSSTGCGAKLPPVPFGRHKKFHDPTDSCLRGPTHCHCLARPQPGLEIAVTLARRPARALGSAVHSAPFPSPNRRLTSTGFGVTAGCSRHVSQSSLNICLTHGVVCHFCSPPSRCPALTIPTIPWAPEWI